jgi:hypothetical protein
MPDDMERTFGALSLAVPTSTPKEGYYAFSAQTLPAAPSELVTDRLYVRKGTREHWRCFRSDVVTFHAEKETYRQLALLILAVVLHPEPEQVTVQLTHHASEVTHLVVSYDREPPESLGSGYYTRPYVFNYDPGEAVTHPWYDLCLTPTDLPCFCLTYDLARHYGDVEETWRGRDILKGFGTDRGCVRLAELLLNLSRPENALTDCELEGEASWRSVGPRSAEARFELPGSVFWEPAQWRTT